MAYLVTPIGLLFLLSAPLLAEDTSQDYSARANAIQAQVNLEEIASSSAMQVSQVHDQARTKLLVLLVQQNDEIIQLLKDVKNKKLIDFFGR